ncbi:MAG: SUMF1/EgtB/PvdO family nonheme iron enzyme [Treponema sp.]|uniref:SUMF1/EgtB/PvdO family nonheme iron enzyme n=1 Tax=Treponema sp. TaxID=166 RepID=UPI003FA25C33
MKRTHSWNKSVLLLSWLAGALLLTAFTVSCKANVSTPIAVTGVTLDQTTVILAEEETLTLKATVQPEKAVNKKVVWSSDNTAVATVGQDGTVTAKKAGTTKIKVTTADGGKTASCTVTVTLIEYTITYNCDGGSNHADNPPKYTVETETITLKPANKVDHIFFGWYANADFSGEKVTEISKGASGNKALYAKFIEMKMIDIAAVTNGTLGHADYSNNNGEHTVSLTAYRIGETEVTQELWQAVMGDNPSKFDNSPYGSEVQGKRPVERVNWCECIAFCNELTKKVPELGESQCVYTVDGHTYGTADATAKKVPAMDMNKKGFRLPTEAEWEWAAKGGTKDKWTGTNEESKLVNYAWYNANSSDKTHAVKQKQANGYGLYDMSGNVWEWCWDWYDNTPAGGQDPTGAVSGTSTRVMRGGSWTDNAEKCAVGFRYINYPGISNDNLGLRVACRP